MYPSKTGRNPQKKPGNYSDETKYIQKKSKWAPVACCCCYSVETCRHQITRTGHTSAICVLFCVGVGTDESYLEKEV